MFGFGLIRRWRESRRRREDEDRLAEGRVAEAIRISDLRRKIAHYPRKIMTFEEFENLPRNVSSEFLRTCPLGTMFVCDNSDTLDLHVVGQVVKGDDLFCDQWGAGLVVPDRGVNRYLVTRYNPEKA